MKHYLKDELYQLIKTDDRIFDFLQEGAMDGLWYWDLENPEHEWMNKRFWEILGYDPEMMPHKASAWQDIINHDDLAVAIDNFNKHVADPDHPYDQEVRYRHKNGSTVWVRCRGKAIRNKEGKPIRMLGVHQDITALKIAQEKINESEQRFRTIFENAPIMIDAFDSNGNCVLWNKECENILGFSIEEINQAEDPFALFYPDEKIRNEVRGTVVSNPDKKLREWNPRAKNGEEVPSLWANFKLSESMVISMGIDISKRKKIEKRINEKNEQFETIIKGANLGWWDWDIPSGDEVYNDTLAENLGYKLNEITPHIKWWEDKIHPDDYEKVTSDLKEHFQGKTAFYSNKHRLITKEGEWKWFLDYGRVVEWDEKENPVRMIGTLRDIDNEERASKQLKESLEQIKIINAKTPNIIWKSDIGEEGDFIHTYISEAADDFLGLPAGTIGNSWDIFFEYVLPEYLPLVDRCFKYGIANINKPVTFEYQVKKADGNIAWFSSTGIVKDDDKKLTVYGSTIDITEKKHAEAALEESETRFKALHNASFGGITIHDKGVILECNNGLSEITGYDREELIGMNGLLLIAQESRDMVSQKIESGYEQQYEAIGVRKSGEKYPLRLEAKEIPYKGKNVRVVEFRDITQQKEAENKLLESEEMLRNIFENSTSLIYSHDINNVIDYVSPQVQEILGYTQEEARVNWTELLSDNPINIQGVGYTMKAIETGIRQPAFELEFVHKNGKKVLVEVREAPVVKNGKTVYIVGICNDISARKQNETALLQAKKRAEENEHKVRSMFENTQIGIIFCDTNGNILEVNPVILEILGSPSIEATKKINVLTFQPLVEIGFAKNVKKCIDEKTRITEDVLYTSKWGKTVFMKYYIIPVVVNDKVIGVWANLNNLSDIYKIQNQLQSAKDKAEESDRLKSAFLSNMSHEIRTPMNGILGFTELLKEPNLSGERKEKYIEIIRKSGDRMLDTVNDIIDISKIDAGQMEVSHNSVNINEEIETLYEFFQVEAKGKGIEMRLICNLKPDENSFISDKNKLNSIISNLIKNAIKYTDEGTIEISCSKSDSTFHLNVRDTGIGIPTKRINSIFNRFEQADIGDTHAREGSGLGLAISKAYVEMLGGNIGVNSRKGEGSTFFFSIPWVQAEVPQINTPENNQSDTKESPHFNILIAEDDDISFQHLEIILSNITKKITRASNGLEAIEQLKKDPETDLILMDIKMPELDGLSATKEIRKFNKEIFIIAQTANALEGDKEKAIAAGCNDYITKPIVKKKLLELVEMHIKK